MNFSEAKLFLCFYIENDIDVYLPIAYSGNIKQIFLKMRPNVHVYQSDKLKVYVSS